MITFDMGGAREILDAETGLLVEPGNVNVLATALKRLIENRELRSRLGYAGPARALSLCEPGQQMQKLTDLLQFVMRRRGAISS